MATKIDVRKVLTLKNQGVSANMLEKVYHISKRSTKKVLDRKEELDFDLKKLDEFNDDELYLLFFPDNINSGLIYQKPDYEYVHKELSKKGVTLKLLWQEYCSEITGGKYPISYTSFCREYNDYYQKHNYTNRIIHKPGVCTEVDWAGATMSFTDFDTGEIVKVYMFVATLPFSQYVYVEPTLDMKMDTWINCNIHMFEFFGGSTIRIVSDNLKTGVVSHPKEGDIILTEAYEQFGEHYLTAIMPAQVKKPKQKASVEGNVGKITTAIIAKLRNKHFNSFILLKDAVHKALTEFNEKEFQKRDGSRKLIFENEEKEHLRKLPEIPFEVSSWTYCRKVGLNCHIQYAKNYYSVPYQYVGKEVDLRVTKGTLTVYYKDKRLTSHSLFPSYITNKYSTHEADMPSSVKVSEWDDIRIRRWASNIGESTSEVIDRIFCKCKVKEQGYNPSLSVLKLSKKYGNERLEAACQIALRKFPSPRYKHLKAILSNNQDNIPLNETKEADINENRGAHLRGGAYYGGKRND